MVKGTKEGRLAKTNLRVEGLVLAEIVGVIVKQ